jgi:hypothetical protein
MILRLLIIFEVYKRVAYDVNSHAAYRALDFMLDRFELSFVASEDLAVLRRLMDSMPRWDGSLEDATIAMTGLRRDIPVWTFNYRDL